MRGGCVSGRCIGRDLRRGRRATVCRVARRQGIREDSCLGLHLLLFMDTLSETYFPALRW